MKEYRLFVQTMYDRSVGFYETYGVAVFDDGEMSRVVRDVSVERDKVEALVARFNREHLEPEHLGQAIEEFLFDFEVT